MKEGGSGFQEMESRQIQLANELVTTSGLLSVIFPHGQSSDRWHVISPHFETPKVSIFGYDVSDTLVELAKSTRELHVSQSYLEEEWDGSDYYPPSRAWEVFPPQGSGFFGTYKSDCNGSADLPGIGLTAHIPDVDKPFNNTQIHHLTESGYLYIDLMSWRRPNEGLPYRYDKPESVMMNLIGRDKIASLEVANWFLKGLLSATDIHPEKVLFQA